VAELADAALAELERTAPDELPDLLGLTNHAGLTTMLLGSRGRARWYLRELDGARADLGTIVEAPGTYPVWHVHCHGTLALIEAWAGNLVRARELANRGLSLAGRHGLLHHPATLDVRAALAAVHRERGELDLAERQLDHLLAIANRTRRPTAIAVHAIERAQVRLAAGRADQGLATLEAERAAGEVTPPEILLRRRQAVEIRLLLAVGDHDAAHRLLGRARAGGDLAPELRTAAVQCALAGGDLAGARALLDATPPGPATERRDRLEHGLLVAAVDLLAGDRRSAVDRARRVVQEASSDGQRRIFLDLGPAVEAVLRAVLRVEPAPHLASVLGTPGDARPRRGADVGLSDREAEVVRYLPTPLTNAEIAAQLYISLNTLKSHLASIYKKLGVTDRRGAIARAEELGLA
jgi:LuxR family maltose regulon positive regulatory protein